ncbi:hypothetical protein C8J56DRAFT_278382 [Mycena floridula]|nr:hypothetical protein C8J56DRAFT_278382 [Mycena floridula]
MVAILQILPDELTTEIIHLCDSSTLARLCYVSQKFTQLAKRELYKIIVLGQPESVVQLDATLHSNPEYPGWVRALSFREASSVKDHDAVERILQSTTGLILLCICLPLSLGSNRPKFETWSFPQLRIFQIKQARSFDHANQHATLSRFFFRLLSPQLITPFLNRHPTISTLTLSAAAEIDLGKEGTVNLPSLALFEGRTSRALIQGAPNISSLLLTMKTPDSLGILPALCRNLVVVVNEAVQPDHLQDIFRQVQHQLPSLKSFGLILDSSGLVPEQIQGILDEYLPKFEDIESFGLLTAHDPSFHNSLVSFPFGHCPTLREFFLLRRLRDTQGRYKVVDGKVQPTNEPCRMETLFVDEDSGSHQAL